MPLLKAGTREDLGGSMAQAMVKAFKTEWENFKGTPPPEVSIEYLTPFFVAVAQGVVRHLKDNAEEALEVFDVEVKQKNSLIEVSGETETTSSGLYSHKHQVTLTQKKYSDPSQNKVKCENGTGKVKIHTSGVLYT